MSIQIKDETRLEDLDILDLTRSFVAVSARQWQRRTVNRLIAHIQPQLDEARREGHKPDTVALLRDAWLELGFTSLLESSDETPND